MVNAKANQVLLLSVLTLIYRAIPAAAGPQPDVSADCIAAARAALEEHQKCIEMIPSDNVSILIMHLNWYEYPVSCSFCFSPMESSLPNKLSLTK